MFTKPTADIEEAQVAFVRAIHDDWALVTAGTQDSWNTMTIGWGEAGTLWGTPTITVYVHPRRHTHRFILENEFFTVQLFEPKHKRDLALLGAKSGRDGDKVSLTSLTPKAIEHGITFEEARLTLVCRKLYTHQIDLTQVPAEVLDHFAQRKDNLYAQGAHLAYTAEVVEVLG